MAWLLWALIGMTGSLTAPNTGHSLTWKPVSEIETGRELSLTWELTARKARRRLERRINDTTLHHRSDGGNWSSKPCAVRKTDHEDSLTITATFEPSELADVANLEWYLTYEFDGSESGGSGALEPRLIRITTNPQQGAAPKR